MISLVSALLVLASVVSCLPDGYGIAPVHPVAPPKYNFDYAVHDDYKGAHFGHSEARDGYVTKGQYYVGLPDGRLQEVTYTADAYGYHPVVTYKGAAQHPSYGVGHGVVGAHKVVAATHGAVAHGGLGGAAYGGHGVVAHGGYH